MDIGLSRDEVARVLSESGVQSPAIINAVYQILDANNRALERYLKEMLRQK